MKAIRFIAAFFVVALCGCETSSLEDRRVVSHTYQDESHFGIITLMDFPDEARGVVTSIDKGVARRGIRLSTSEFNSIWAQLKASGIEKHPSPGQFNAKYNYVIAMKDPHGAMKVFVIPKKSAPPAIKSACQRIRKYNSDSR